MRGRKVTVEKGPPERQAVAQGTELPPGASSAQVSRHHIYPLATIHPHESVNTAASGRSIPLEPAVCGKGIFEPLLRVVRMAPDEGDEQ